VLLVIKKNFLNLLIVQQKLLLIEKINVNFGKFN